MLAGLHSRPIKRVLSLEPLLFIGKVSFGIYLIHYFFFYPPFSAADWFGWRAAEVVFVTILAASLSFYAFERYFIALGERIARMVTRSRYVKEADQIS
jgi:peptidoglycan/LPS O-acetylase OafA/YrhL